MTTTKTNLLKNLMNFKSIKTKLTVIIIVMLLINGTILTGIATLMASNALEEASINTLEAVGDGTSVKLLLSLGAGQDLAALTANDSQVVSTQVQWNEGTLTEEELIAFSEYLLVANEQTSDFIKDVNILDMNGICIGSNVIGNRGGDYSHFLPSINQQKNSNPYITEPFLGSGDEPQYGVMAPILDSSGKQIGFTLTGLRMEVLTDHVFTTPGLSNDATNFLVGSDGTIFSDVNGDYSALLTRKFDLSIFPAGKNLAQAPGYYGKMAYIVKTPLPSTNWFIITTETVRAVNDPISSLAEMMLLSLLIVIVAGLFAAAFISNNLARPIKALSNTAEQMALGDMSVDITHTGIDEIGQLADAFRRMVKNAKVRENAIQRIASGDIKFAITMASDKDMEGKSLIQMKATISNMIKLAHTLAEKAAEGELSYTVDVSQFQGVYVEFFTALDQAFDLIINPLQEARRLAVSYSEGDYSDRFDPTMTLKGDFVPLKDSLNRIGINTSSTLLKIRSGVHDMNSGIGSSEISTLEEITSSIITLAEGSSRVSSLAERNDSGLEQALIAMLDLANMVSEVAKRAVAVSELINQSSDLAYDGVKRAELAGKGMEEIMGAAAANAKSVSDISSQMDEIGGIVDVISGIAEQTNLLALNAAIEAARAGDAGLGFAVVADEVKSLAQESQRSAEHISSIIGNLQKITTEMATGMTKATEVVQSGSNAVNEAVTIFQQMAEAIEDVNKNMREVAVAAEEQAASVQEITASMGEVQSMVQDTAREATDSAAVAEEISASLEHLKDIAAQAALLTEIVAKQVAQFKID